MSLKVRAECLEAQSPITLQDGDTLGMDGEEPAVLPSLGDVGLSRLLEGQESRSSELGISGVGGSKVADQALEREAAKKHVGDTLVLLDITESDGARTELAGFLDPGGGFLRETGFTLRLGLGGKGLAGGFTAGITAGSLLSAGHRNEGG